MFTGRAKIVKLFSKKVQVKLGRKLIKEQQGFNSHVKKSKEVMMLLLISPTIKK